MNYIELSTKNVEEKSIEIANEIQKEFKPDIVVFISKGAFQIGNEISKYCNVSLLEIYAQRKVGSIKSFLKIFMKLIPASIKKKLREKEIKTNIHEKNTDRNVYFEERKWGKYKKVKNILIVDDSIDTGNTMIQVKEKVQEYFKDCNIKIMSFNTFTKSENIIKTDYYIWKDTMLNGPWSNDSKYNKEFIKQYKKWKRENDE